MMSRPAIGRHGSSRGGMSEAGFTLLELMIVLAIVVAVSMLALPRIGGAGNVARARAEAAALGATLREARAAALRDNSSHWVTIDPLRRIYWSSLASRRRSLAASDSIDVAGAGLDRTEGDRATVVFRPDGSAADGIITLASGGRRIVLVVDWLTGATRQLAER